DDPPSTPWLRHAGAAPARRQNLALVDMRVLPVGIDLRQLRRDALDGQVSVEQLLDLIDQQQQSIQRLRRENQRLQDRLAPYEPEVRNEKSPRQAPAETPSPSYSVEAEEKRRRGRRRRKKSPGRRPTELKFADAERTQDIYPDGVRRGDCQLVRERAVWRLQDGRAVLVGYRIFAGPGGREPRIPGVTRRCEYGLEFLVVLAFLVYLIGISLDKACAVLGFFCQLPLAKSQADALLRQLAQHWDGEFDVLCTLIAHAAVVYMDETGWKVGSTGCSLWAFASQWQRLFLFGCRKDDDTLDQILPPDVFDGTGVSDDAAVYRGRFRRAQKCWAHLLRKIIRLALLYPRKKTYQRFLDELLELYRDAKRAAADRRLGDEGRRQRICDLENRLYDLCRPHQRATTSNLKPHQREFANLIDELIRLLLEGELFTFVFVAGVEPTNNLTERLLRGPAQDRKAGRTNQTAAGAHRRSVIVSVLESLRVHLHPFTLATVLQEVGRWMKEGISLFARQWQALKADVAAANTS
ncbi:MAG: IS66 family transposase, partial [Burkholderiales bacterium]